MKVRSISSIFAIASIFSSCSLVELADFSEDNDTWISQVPSLGHLYAVGVSYPDDYDWRSDPLRGEITCSLVVFMDGRIIMKTAAGNRHHVSTDPDMIRMIDGNLYTDFSTADRTIVKKNGKELFSYLGRESMADFKVYGDDVYTLGNSREGMGFSIRKNGILIYKDSKCLAYPHLTIKDGLCHFCFREYRDGASVPYAWYFFDGQSKRHMNLPHDTRYVDDALYINGQVISIIRQTSKLYTYLFCNGDLLLLHDNSLLDRIPSRMNLSASPDGQITVYGNRGFNNIVTGDITGLTANIQGFSNMIGIQKFANTSLCYLSSFIPSDPDVIMYNGNKIELPQNYRAMGLNPLCMWQGQIYVALNPDKEGSPVIWTENGIVKTGINGCLYDLYVME